MSKNQFKGLAYMKNVDALNYAPSNRAKGSLLRREEGGEVCEMDYSKKPPGKTCKRVFKSVGKKIEKSMDSGPVAKVLGALGMVGAGIGLGIASKRTRE